MHVTGCNDMCFVYYNKTFRLPRFVCCGMGETVDASRDTFYIVSTNPPVITMGTGTGTKKKPQNDKKNIYN